MIDDQAVMSVPRLETSPRKSEERFRQIFENAATGIAITDLNGRYVQFNKAYRDILGYTTDELNRLNCFDLVHPEDVQFNAEMAKQLVGGQRQSFEIENRYVRKDGSSAWVIKFVSLLHDDDGNPSDFISLVTDVTSRRSAQQLILDREQRISAILNTVADSIITFNSEGIIETVNAATLTMFGYEHSELVGKKVQLIFGNSDHEPNDCMLAQILPTEHNQVKRSGNQLCGRRRDGSVFQLEVAISQVGRLDLFTALVRDLTERLEMQRQILEIASKEDLRIGAELHDDIQQQLTGLSLLAVSLVDQLEVHKASGTENAKRLARGINEVNSRLRMLARGLIPVEIHAGGLRSALDELAQQVALHYEVQCSLECCGDVLVADNYVATHLFRICQEAISNAVRHGKANRIDISLLGDVDSICLRIHNDGIKFPKRTSSMDRSGKGLNIMRYRAELISATIQIQPGSADGTVVECRVAR